MNKKIKIAIEIDFILRDSINSLINIYEKQIDYENKIIIRNLDNINDLYKFFPFPQYKYIEQQSDIDKDIIENILVVDEQDIYESNEEFFNKFTIDNILEIYGYAKETIPNIFLFLNEYEKNNKDILELTLYSKIKGKGKSATHFFLSKCSSEVSNLKFINDYDELKEFNYIFSYKNISQSLSIKNILIIIKNDFMGHDNEIGISQDLKYELNDLLQDDNYWDKKFLNQK